MAGYAEGTEIIGVGFWRMTVAAVGLLAFAALRPRLFRVDRTGLLLVGLGGGAMVAPFEVAFQFAIAGAGVAGAAALLYTAPGMVALVAHPLLGERLTLPRIGLAVGVMVGAALTVQGGGAGVPGGGLQPPGTAAGVVGGLLAATAYAGTTLLARFAVPRYGAVRVLLLELTGGALILAVVLPLTGNAPAPATTLTGWIYLAALALGSVPAANFLFFAGVRRIEAAPTAVAATIEPVVGAILALLLFSQRLTILGWLGLLLVVASVATGYWRERSDEPSQ